MSDAAAAARTVLFYFDLVSPYAWLAAQSIGRIEAAGVAVRCQPVLFAGLLNANGNTGPAEIAVKRRYTFRDVMRQAALLKLPFRGPPGHPFNPLLGLRMCTALPDDAQRRELMGALMACCWEQGGDISDPAVAQGVASSCGLDGALLVHAAGQPAIKQQLADATAQAVAADVFGVPTFAVDNELFWGGDRIDALLAYLGGARLDPLALSAFLGLPGSAHRPARR